MTGHCDNPNCRATGPLDPIGEPGDDNYGGTMIGRCPVCHYAMWAQHWAGGRQVKKSANIA